MDASIPSVLRNLDELTVNVIEQYVRGYDQYCPYDQEIRLLRIRSIPHKNSANPPKAMFNFLVHKLGCKVDFIEFTDQSSDKYKKYKCSVYFNDDFIAESADSKPKIAKEKASENAIVQLNDDPNPLVNTNSVLNIRQQLLGQSGEGAPNFVEQINQSARHPALERTF